MCGIIGFTGARNCAEILLDGLQQLEYRGYDSAGLAIGQDGELRTYKAVGLSLIHIYTFDFNKTGYFSFTLKSNNANTGISDSDRVGVYLGYNTDQNLSLIHI